ncbi:MAG TPA: SdrD B-like domain-containing protein [Thermoanaerobaculia bacterium]
MHGHSTAVTRATVALGIGILSLLLTSSAYAQGALRVEIVNGYNLVVDSNVTSPSTYGPSAAYIGANVCNIGNAPLQNVIAYTGDYKNGIGSTPGLFPVFNSAGDPRTHLTNTGTYSLTLESGTTGLPNATRYIGDLEPGQCRIQYWLITYPQCVNVGGERDTPPCEVSITGGVKPDDDLSLNYDIWATTSTAIAQPTVSQRRSLTMRNEISAAANKIWPNTDSKVPDAYLAAIQSVLGWGTLGPDGQPLTDTSVVYPGQRVITSQGIWYDVGNVNHGFDNNGDLIPDQNAWLQPVGDAAQFDAGCFRLINAYGLIIVKLKGGGELLIPFSNQLYFENIPDNTGVVGLVYYQFVATDSGCSAAMTPYQEAASGFDNEKFSADFGFSSMLTSGEFDTNLNFTKTDGLTSTTVGSTLTYTLGATNTTNVPLGAPDVGVPMVFRETIPAGTSFISGSADDNPTNNLIEPAGGGSYTQYYTDNEGNVDACTINYNITSSRFVLMYSTNSGATWTLTEPLSGVTDIQWILLTTMQTDGGHNSAACVPPGGGLLRTVETSLPPGKSVTLNFQVTVLPTVGPIVCNTAQLGFGGGSSSTTATDCTVILGNNTLSGRVFRDNGTGVGGIFGNGTFDGTETGIGAGVVVVLYYDANGDGLLDDDDIVFGQTTTGADGTYGFSQLPDGPYLVAVKKYDGDTSDGINNAATDTFFGTNGWGSTTYDPNLPLTTDQGVLKLNESLLTTTLAVNIDLDGNNAAAQNLAGVDFGYAPPLRVTKRVSSPTVLEGSTFTYTIALENRLPAAGRQGPTGCQYTVWAPTGTNGPTNGNRDFTAPANAWDGPNRTVASAVVQNGGNRYIQGTGFTLAPQPGNITRVEALYFGYFNAPLTDDNLTLTVYRTNLSNSTTLSTALIDSYIGQPADLDPNSAISWNITGVRPGGGSWSWSDVAAVTTEVNPGKTANADFKTFFLDAIGLRITTDQDCIAGASTTLSPVPLQDSYDNTRMEFVSATPPPTSATVAGSVGFLKWDNVGPILAGSTEFVLVTMKARNITGTVTGNCAGSSPPAPGIACNWATTAFDGKHVEYLDGREANDDSSSVPVNIEGASEIRGSIWRDLAPQNGWPIDSPGSEPRLPNVSVTLWACLKADGTMASTTNQACSASQNGSWVAVADTVTDASGNYEFIGLRTGYYLVEVGNTDGVPGSGNTSPFNGTQTAEPNDVQNTTLVSGNTFTANGTNGICAGGTCNNTWGSPTVNLGALQLVGGNEEIINGVNFGYFITNAIAYGNIWWDVDGDATRDFGETGLSGFTVQLYNSSNTLVGTTITDTNGNYWFSGLAAGDYTIAVIPPTLLNKTWIETVESTGGTSSLDNRIPITLAAGQISGSHDFGYKQIDNSAIGDRLYYDFNGNGIQDANEDGIPNVTVWLYQDVDRDGYIDDGVDTLLYTDVTDASGSYLFENLPAGSYIVKIDTSDPDFPTNVTPTADPDVNGASIGDLVFYDANGNGTRDAGDDGIAGVVVRLYTDTDGNGSFGLGDTLVASTLTDINGNYLFTGLTAGSYFIDIVEETLPSPALALTTSDLTLTPIILASSSTATAWLHADAGYSPAANFAIGNRIWHDVNNNGVQDPGEPGIPNITITVTNGTGTGCSPSCTAVTDEGGFWIVTGLTNGTFIVDVLANYLQDPDFPRDFTLFTGSLPEPRTVTVAGADLTNVDFGYRFTGAGTNPTGTISGRVFLDLDNDLAYDNGEARVGKTVNLLDDQNNVVATTVTDGDGTYSFNGIFVGTYSVQAVDQIGVRYSTIFLAAAQTFGNLNIIYNASSVTTPDYQSSVSVDGVYPNLLQDFGFNRFLSSIGDTIYWDVNENGTQDIGEPGLAGVTVRLYEVQWTDTNGDGYYQSGEAVLGTPVLTRTTTADDPLTAADEGGRYLFSNLPDLAPDHYYLVVVDTGTLPGNSPVLIADPDTDGSPCNDLPPGVPASICDSQQLIVGLLPGANYLGADFGYRINGSGFATIGDQLWIDTNGDGIRDPGEPGIPFITVWMDDGIGGFTWTDSNGNGVWDAGEGDRWVQTDSDGYYVFTDVADGSYTIRVLTSDPDWPAGLSTTPTYEASVGNVSSRDNRVVVQVTGGVVTAIDDAPGACPGCNLDVDFGYRYAGTNSLSGTICVDGPTPDGRCGSAYSGVEVGVESALSGVQVSAYRWTDDGDGSAWDGNGVLDPSDAFVFLGTTSTDAQGDYSFTSLPDNVIIVFGLPAAQNLKLTTTNANSAAEDAAVKVATNGLYEGTSPYNGNTVTTTVRQALRLNEDGDQIIRNVDFAFDPTLGGTLIYDFGDLPASYSITLLSQSGARHLIGPGGIHLGAGITNETDGKPDPNALGDVDDGVSMVSHSFFPGGEGAVQVVASAAGWLAAWIDFDQNGDFTGPHELIIDQPVSEGLNTIAFYTPTTIPNVAGVTTFFTRFRIYPERPQFVASTGPALDSSFQIMGGEVEDWAFDIGIIPTLVDMATITATEFKNHVLLTWETTSEIDNLGFHIYRQSSSGVREKLNEHIIPGSAFMTGRRALGPRSYRYMDKKPPSGFMQYWIEDVDLDGTVTMHGPISPSIGTASMEDTTVETDADPTLGSVGGIFTTAPGMGVKLPDPPAPTQNQLEEQWKLAAVPAAKVVVTRTGWYRVRKSDLLAAGFDPGSNGRNLAVFTDGIEVPVVIDAKNESKFDPADSIEFFGQELDTPGTGGRIYYITSRKGKAERIKSTGGRGGSGSPSAGSFPYTFERIERTGFFAALTNNGERENFFGAFISSAPVSRSLTVANPAATGNAELEVVIQGATENMQHIVQVSMNGTSLGYVYFDGQERHVARLPVPMSLLVEGENTLTMKAQNGPNDFSGVESIRLVYPHRYRADSDALMFTAQGGSSVVVDGFTTNKVRVVDVTDPAAPFFINATIGKGSGGSTSISFTSEHGTRTIFAFADSRVLSPAQIAWNEPSTWNATTNAARFVILTNRAFVDAANNLKAARDAQGIPTVVVDVQNVYDEFSFGQHSPHAIRNFLARAMSWTTAPRYVLLLGDASFDPRNYLGMGSYDFVPTKLIPTAANKTASDDWFADFSGDGLPSMAIGRLPARTAAQANAMVAKLLARNVASGGWTQNIDLIHDRSNGFRFDTAMNAVQNRLPSGYNITRVDIATTPSPSTAIRNNFNRGALLTNYIGHGSVEIWSNSQFNSAAARLLTNAERLSFVVAMNCLNGYFHDLYTESLAEALIKNPNGGAIGVWASSALTTPTQQLIVNLAFNRHVFGPASITVGDAILQAKRATIDRDVRKTWILFGDPTMTLK